MPIKASEHPHPGQTSAYLSALLAHITKGTYYQLTIYNHLYVTAF